MRVAPSGIESRRISKLPERLAWSNVFSDARAPWDVCVDFTTHKSIMQELRFQVRVGNTTQPVAIPLSLPNTLDCLRFQNSFALRRAVLLQLASQLSPPLVFNASVFIQAQVNPRTWAYMPWPGRLVPAAGIIILGVMVTVLVYVDSKDHHPILMLGGGVLVMAALAFVAGALQHWLLPGFRRSFVFEAAEPHSVRS